ncbi:PKD domain-containing protein [Polaribacter sp. SA4-12]|uniref:PKD domain-containing protein n=1 Tax=Polaribacter sp. SA4-12 TaxID=1312072 RepID=UPI000B3C15E8|nr:PKD domain-containing protein [Polaribacter sp. SA4-12]ARV15350.1 hypothetical protein BTO07_09440 [Polaribacter sp. SA4-12]
MKLKNILPPKIKNSIVLTTIVLISSLLFSSQSNINNYIKNTFFESITATITASNSEVCKGESTSITFEAEKGTSPYTFTYELNNNLQPEITTTSGNAITITLDGTTVGNFTYKLINIKDSSNPVQNIDINDQEETIKVNALPIVDFTFNNDEACSGESVTFTSNVSGVGALTYKWDFGNGKASTSTNPTHTFEALGCNTKPFSVKLTVTDVNGCSSFKTKTIQVKEKPDIAFRDEKTRSNIFSNCDNASASSSNYEVSVENISNNSCVGSFFINWGDGNTSSSATFPAKHTYINIGIYSIKIKATGSNGCVNEVSYEVKNVSNPAGGLASPGNTSNLCLGNSELIFPITNYEQNSSDTTYTIDFGDNTPNKTYTQAEVQAENNISHNYERGSCSELNGEFIATLSVQNACATTTFTVDNIVILESSKAEFETIDKSCVNTSISFRNKSTLGDESGCSKNADVIWDFGDGTIRKFFSVNNLNDIQHTYITAGTYEVSLSIESKCGPKVSTKTICIEPEIIPIFSVDNDEGCIPFAVAATNTTDKTDLCSEPTYKWSVSYASLNCGTSSDWDFTNGTTETSENPQFLFKNSGKYTIIQRVTTGCGTETTTKTIDVKKPPTVSVNNIDDACGSTTINPTATIENCTTNTSALTYNWTFTGGTPASATTLNPGNIEYTTAGIHTITLEVTNDCGISNTATEEFEIFETPTITNSDFNQNICSGQNTTEIILTSNNPSTNYSWSATASANITGFTSNGAANTIPVQTIINNGNTAGTIKYIAVPKLGICEGNPVEFTITINPSPEVTTQPNSSVVCLNGTATLLEVDYKNGVGSATYQWFKNTIDNSTNGTEITGATNKTYQPTTNIEGIIYYYVKISFSSGGCSEIFSETASVIVNKQLIINSTALNQVFCVGGSADEMEVSYINGTGSPSYQWYKNNSNTNTGGNLVDGATNSTYTPIGLSSAGTFYYYVEVSLDGIGCNSANSEVFQIDILLDPVIDAQAITTQELCQNATPKDLTVTVSGGSTTDKTYQWYVNTDSATDGSSAILNATSATYTPSTTAIGSLYYYVVVSQAESGCSVESEVSVVKVNEAPVFTKQPISSEICLDGTATLLEVAYQNGTGTAAYQWFSNTTNSNSGGTAITGAQTDSYNPPTNNIGTTFYYVEISFSTGGCSQIFSNTAKVEISPQLTVNPVADAQIVCIGGTANELEVSFSGGTGNATYQWFLNTTNSNSGGTIITGETKSKYTTSSFSATGNFYFYAKISLEGNGCSSANSNVFQIEVVPDAIIDTQPIGVQELCQGTTPIDLMVTVSGGTTSLKDYQWYKNSATGTVEVGANSNMYTPDTNDVGIFNYYVIITQSESGCSVTSEVSKLIVNEAPIITTQPIASEVCLDGVAVLLEVAYKNGVGAPAYQWFSNTTDTNSGGIKITGAINANYNPPTSVIGITYYYLEISFSSGGCSQILSNTAKVEISPQLTVNPVAVAQIVCIGGIANELEVSFSGGTGNATYQWFSNTTNSNSGGTIISGATNSKYTPSSFSTAGNFYFYAEISLDGNGCSSANSAIFQIEVILDPVIDTQPIVNQELCQSSIPENLTITVSGGTTSAKTYQWYQNNTNSNSGGTLIVGEVSIKLTPNTANVGTFYYYVMVSQPEADCSITSDVSKLIVNTAPTFLKQPISSEICLDETATELEVAYKNGTGTATYQWFSNTVDDVSTGTAISGETNTTYNPPTNTVGTTYYYAIISFTSGGCSEIISDAASVIVNEIPVINSAEITIYSEATFNFDPNSIAGNVVPNGTKYTWSAPNFNPTGSILGTSAETTPQDQISQTLENTGTLPIIVTYIITPATTKCDGSSFALEVTVNPSINSNAIVVNNSCFESNDGSVSTNIDGGIPFETGSPYLISWIGPNGFTSTNATITNLEIGLYTITIEDKSGFTFTEEFNITQPTVLAIAKDLEKNISCFNGNDGEIEVTISGGTLPYTYNWTTTNGSGIVQNAENQNVLTAGNYTLEITDKNNCTTSTNIVLTEPEGLKIATVFKQDILCFGDATGAVEMNVSGGTKIEISPGVFDYLYSWSGPKGFTSSSKNISNLSAGTYTLAVTDSLGCTTNATFIINQSAEIKINYTKTDVTCYGETDGAITVTVTGGVAPYKISWSNLANGFSQSNLSADTYIATIIDKNNCIEQVSIIIEQPIFFIDPVVSPISCNGANDGSIDLNLTGGISPTSITWSDDASAGVQRNNLSAGTYTVVILDSDVNQCPIEETFIFTNPPAIGISSTVIDAIDCSIVNSGSIDLEISGGSKPYSFLWSTNETTEDLENIPPGDYSVEITDANGCNVNRQFNIFRQDPINISFLETTITDCVVKYVSKQIEANVTGGYLPYTYTWSAGTTSGLDNSIMTTSQNGSYTLIITDNKGCIATKSIIINVPTIGIPEFRYHAFAIDKYDLLSIEDPIQFTNLSIGEYSKVTWNFGDGSPIVKEEKPIHTYDKVGEFKVILTIEYDAGCIETVERTVIITKGYLLVNPNAFTPNGDGYNETIRPSHRGFIELEMTIYDTWGTSVYYEKGINLNGWNGVIKGLPAENGNYIMVVKGLTFYKKEIIKTSPITLLK